MKLVHGEYNISLLLQENRVAELIVEEPNMLTRIVDELYQQCQGEEGNFVLSKDNKILSIKKNISFLLEPFSLNFNNKTLLTKLYQDLEKNQTDIILEEWGEFYREYIRYMDRICMRTNFPISYEEQLSLQDVLKLGKVKIQVQAITLVEKVREYIYIENQLIGTSIFVFLNLKTFLTENEIKQLYQECFYKKIHIILIESVYQKKMQEEQICIIDKDACMIYI